MFSLNLSPSISLPSLLPFDPSFDLIINLPPLTSSLHVQKALLTEQSKYFQQLSLIKGLKSIEISKNGLSPKILESIIRLMYGEKLTFSVDELALIENAMDFLDLKKGKEIMKSTIKIVAMQESLDVFFKIFDFFALRDHKKFCKDVSKRLGEIDFFEKLVRYTNDFFELSSKTKDDTLKEENEHKELLNFLSEKSFVKLVVLLYQEEIKKYGVKAKEGLITKTEKIVRFYNLRVLKKEDQKYFSLMQDFLHEINPEDRKFMETELIQKLTHDVAHLKKSNISLNNQIQSLKSKEQELKGKLNVTNKRLDRLEMLLAETNPKVYEKLHVTISEKINNNNNNNYQETKYFQEKSERNIEGKSNEIIPSVESEKNEVPLSTVPHPPLISHGKFDDFLAYNEETKKMNKSKLSFQSKKKDSPAFNKNLKLPNEEIKTGQRMEKSENKKLGSAPNPKKNIHEYFHNDEHKPMFYSYFSAIMKSEKVSFKSIWEGEKNLFKIQTLWTKMSEVGPKLLFIKIKDREKVKTFLFFEIERKNKAYK